MTADLVWKAIKTRLQKDQTNGAHKIGMNLLAYADRRGNDRDRQYVCTIFEMTLEDHSIGDSSRSLIFSRTP